MKKSLKIFLTLLTVFFFAQVCFAPYTINPDIPDSVNPDIPDSNPDETQKVEKATKVILWTVVIILGTIAVVWIVALVAWMVLM